MKFPRFFIAAASGVASLATLPALAQSADEGSYFKRDRYTAVTERAQPEFDPEPIQNGAFLLRPQLEVGVGARSNLFASSNNKVSDVFLTIVPSISADTTWSRNALGFNAYVAHAEFLDTEEESATGYGATVTGRLDANSSLNFDGRLIGDRSYEPRSSAASLPDALEPVEIDRIGGEAGVNYEFGRVKLRGRVGADDFDFADVALRSGGTADQDFRDRTDLIVGGRAAYAMERDWALFAEAEFIDRNYDAPTALNPSNRDNQGVVFLVGSDFELNSLMRGEVAVGYQTFEFDDAAFSDVDGISLDARLQYFVTELTTLTGAATRTVTDSGLAGSAGTILTGVDLRADHELRRNLLIFGEVNFANFDFQDVDRNDDRFIIGGGTTWKLNKRMALEAGYQLIDQSSNVQDFTDNRVLVTLKLFP